jgi:hypothetical protein
MFPTYGSGNAQDPLTTKGASLLLDFADSPARSRSVEFEVTEVLGTIREKWDAVGEGSYLTIYHILRVAPRSSSGKNLPKPLLLASKAPQTLTGRSVCVISFPFEDTRVDPAVRAEAFTQRYGVKRLEPGLLIGSSSEGRILNHDCFTLGGSGGAPVIDLETMQVVGIHHGGRANHNGYYKFNYATSIWSLADKPLLQDIGVNFAPR